MKTYLLLRNNKQSGPYSLDDLQQLGLKDFDLIWIDKKSSAWRYPSEVKELASLIPATEAINSTTVDTATSKVVNIANSTPFSKTGSDNFEYISKPLADVSNRSASHVVALKPTVNNTHIRTIKSTASRNLVQVQIRTADTLPVNTAPLTETRVDGYTPEYIISPEHNSILEPTSRNKYQNNSPLQNTYTIPAQNKYITDNKLELAVLVIGAVSLLAIVFLLLTSPY